MRILASALVLALGLGGAAFAQTQTPAPTAQPSAAPAPALTQGLAPIVAPTPPQPAAPPAPAPAAAPEPVAPAAVAPSPTAAPSAPTAEEGITRDDYIAKARDAAAKRAATRFDEMDADHDGVLTKEEIAAYHAAHERHKPTPTAEPH